MQGHVLKFRSDIGIGIIQGEDGRSYRFSRREVLNAGASSGLVGEDVDFLVDALSPRAIVLDSGSSWTAFGPADRV